MKKTINNCFFLFMKRCRVFRFQSCHLLSHQVADCFVSFLFVSYSPHFTRRQTVIVSLIVFTYHIFRAEMLLHNANNSLAPNSTKEATGICQPCRAIDGKGSQNKKVPSGAFVCVIVCDRLWSIVQRCALLDSCAYAPASRPLGVHSQPLLEGVVVTSGPGSCRVT